MPTFLHTADLHLDSAFSAHFSADGAERRRTEILRCFSRIVDLAAERDILLIAGDLFDSGSVSENTLALVKRKFAEIPNTHIFICAGNHDPLSYDSVYNRESFGENVHIFGTDMSCVYLPELKTRVFGMSFGGAAKTKGITVPDFEKEEGVTDIMMLHADAAVSSEKGLAVLDREFIENSKMDYIALGHIHKRSEPKKYGKTYFAYSGTPEGRGFDECGDCGCYIGEASGDGVKLEFVKTCSRRLFVFDVNIGEATDNLNAVDTVTDAINAHGNENDMYRIYLVGRANADLLSFDLIKNEISGRYFYIEMYDKTVPDFDIEELKRRTDVCGEFVRNMQERIDKAEGEEKAIASDALQIGIEALLGDVGK